MMRLERDVDSPKNKLYNGQSVEPKIIARCVSNQTHEQAEKARNTCVHIACVCL
jgi:hypothetical protein